MKNNVENIVEEKSGKMSWKFPSEFWFANWMELCERFAYYGFFIVLTLYLTDLVGFDDIETGFIQGFFMGGLYFLPPFVGAYVDKIGFRKGLILAFSLLTVGYFLLGVDQGKVTSILFLIILMLGASLIKPLITGTIAKTTTEANRARGFSLFYWIVNIGAFSGKSIVPLVRQEMGLEYINFFSSGMAFIALLIAIFFFKGIETTSESKKLREILESMKKIFTNPRIIALTIIVAGFWLIQGQLYFTMPKYVIRQLGEAAKPEWIANVNPAIVVIFVIIVTQVMKKYRAVNSMIWGMFLMPISAFSMSLSPLLASALAPELGETFLGLTVVTKDVLGPEGAKIINGISFFGLFTFLPLTIMLIIGICIQGLAECFISPRFLEYFSNQAPKGEEGLYLGFSHLHSFISPIIGSSLAGYLLVAYCPDPKSFKKFSFATEIFQSLGIRSEYLKPLSTEQIAGFYEHSHHIWYYFAAIGFVSAIALVLFRVVTDWHDKKNNKDMTM